MRNFVFPRQLRDPDWTVPKQEGRSGFLLSPIASQQPD